MGKKRGMNLAVLATKDEISFNKRKLTDEDLEDLTKVLQNGECICVQLDLPQNQLGLADARFADALARNSTLRVLNLHRNDIALEGARLLSSALKSNRSLHFLWLGSNRIGDGGAGFLAAALAVNRTLRTLELANNDIGDAGAARLAASFVMNATLREVWLQENRIGNAGAGKMAEALGCNGAIVKVFLEYNQIEEELMATIQSIVDDEDRRSSGEEERCPLAQLEAFVARKEDAIGRRDEALALQEGRIAALEEEAEDPVRQLASYIARKNERIVALESSLEEANSKPEESGGGRASKRPRLENEGSDTEARDAVADGDYEKQLEPEPEPVKFTFVSCPPGALPKFSGSVVYSFEGEDHVLQCTGHIVSASPDEGQVAVAVLDLPGRGAVPCLCPFSLLDGHTMLAARDLARIIREKRKAMHDGLLVTPTFTSVPVTRGDVTTGDVQGHLLTSGPGKFLGRVVDDRMLEALRGGCLRFAAQSEQSFYSSDWRFAVREDTLRERAHLLMESPDGIRLSPTWSDVPTMMTLGREAVESQLRWHKTLKQALNSLDRAGRLGEPSLEVRLLQISVGGDPEALVMGKFLPCGGLYDRPNVNVRCACGFVVEGGNPPGLKTLLRRRCNRKSAAKNVLS